MHHEPGALEQVIHFFLFVAGAGMLGAVAVAILEALTADGRRTIGPRAVTVSVGLFVLLFAVERLYHAFT